MKKNDLKSGMVIEMRNGNRFLVVTDEVMINEDSYFVLEEHNDDLTHPYNDSYDIVKVYKPYYFYKLLPTCFDDLNDCELIWDITKREEYLKKLNEAIDKMGDDEFIKLVDKVLSDVK